MNKLEKLIAKLCPNGVEYKPLGEVCHYSAERISSAMVDAHSFVCVESMLQERRGRVDAVSIPSEGNVIAFYEGDVLVGNIRPYLKKIWLADLDGGTNGDVLVIQRNDKAELSSKFLYHVLASDDFFKHDMQYAKGAKMPRGDKDAVMKFEIPLPPLPVQEEIVRMLDDMAGLIGELEDELSARKQQYEWYRDKLFDGKCPEVGFCENCRIIRGDYITKKDAISGPIPVILGGQEPAYYIDHANHTGKAIVVSRSGASAGFVSYWDEPIFATDGFIIESDSELDIRYLYYWLKRSQQTLNGMKKGGGIPHITGENLKSLVIPRPALAEQKKIVARLDAFDKLCNSMTEGLPGEIAARKQQYEYYRDRLLSFRRAG